MMSKQSNMDKQPLITPSMPDGLPHSANPAEQKNQRANVIGIKKKIEKKNQSQTGQANVNKLDRWFVNQILEMVGYPELTVILWDGKEFYSRGEQNVPTMTISDRACLFRLLVNPEINFGDLYSNGRIQFEGDLAAFISDVFSRITDYGVGNKLHKFFREFLHFTFGNSLIRAKQNIYHHYDLSNQFYEMWLDKSAMQYTCAYFPDSKMTLEQAQEAKLHHICQKLQLKEGETVIEAGCGWGGLARFMAQHYGVSVKSYNISREQIAFARNKANDMGLSDKVEYIEDDYRNIAGQCDVFVSVGMLEHVGLKNYKTLGKIIDRTLKSDGRGLIHSISRDEPGQAGTWIEQRIFPGAYAPALSEIMTLFESYQFSIWDIENLRLHYAKTLEHWLLRFEDHVDEITNMFDESFVRAWRLYLCGSIASFLSGANGLLQIQFARGSNNQVPPSRHYLYE